MVYGNHRRTGKLRSPPKLIEAGTDGSEEGRTPSFFVEASVVTVSGLQPVQIFEGTMFHPHALAGKYANMNGSENGESSFDRQSNRKNSSYPSICEEDGFDGALDPSQLEAIASNTGLQLIRELPPQLLPLLFPTNLC